tara:strand:+ start:925 stop:1206 length:282 start_codon:yes stop_codon:yes gene_type:complete
VAKYKKSKSKKELVKKDKEDLIVELKEISTEKVSDESSKLIWNSIEEFKEAVSLSGILYNSQFLGFNVQAQYESYTSNPEEFKETEVYKFLTQ